MLEVAAKSEVEVTALKEKIRETKIKSDTEIKYWKNALDIELKEQVRIHGEDKIKIRNIYAASIKEYAVSIKQLQDCVTEAQSKSLKKKKIKYFFK